MSAFKGGIASAPVILTPEVGSASSTSGGYVGLKRTAPLMTLTDASDNSDLQPCVAEYMCVGGNNPRLQPVPGSTTPSGGPLALYVKSTGVSSENGATVWIDRRITNVDSTTGTTGAVSLFLKTRATVSQATTARITGFRAECGVSDSTPGSSLDFLIGGRISCAKGGSGNVVAQRALQLIGNESTGSGTIGGCIPLDVTINNNPGTTITTAIGIVVSGGTSAGTITSGMYGISIGALSAQGAPAAAAIKLDGQNTGVRGIWFRTNNTDTTGGIVWGLSSDASLYRNSAGVLQTPGDLRLDHLRCIRVPTIAAGAGAGTAPTIAITGTDMGFTITLTQGNPTATGVICTVTFGKTWTVAPRAGISPGNANAAALSGTSAPFVTTTATTLVLNSGSTGLVAGTQYSWHFVTGPAN